MQKKLIALAVAAISAAPVFAQSNVTIYGRADYGFVNKSGGSNGGIAAINSQSQFASGVAAGSRIGFRGNEDLGNGLKAIFEYEFGTGVDQLTAAGAATWGNRHSWVGLTGNFGTVVGGRLDGVRYGIFNKYDAFAGGTVGNFTQMTGQVDRADNAIAYISPNFSGFTVTAAYATNIAGQEAIGNVGDARLNTLMANYENGPISITADYETVKSVEPATAAVDSKTRVATLAGSYDFGMVKVSGLWDSHKTTTGGLEATNYRDFFISAKAPFAGKFVGKFTWGKFDNKLALASNDDATKFGLGVDYLMSKRTLVYADFGRINNKGVAAFNVTQAANVFGGTAATGRKGFDLGIAHTF